jgi:hypothetical protein
MGKHSSTARMPTFYNLKQAKVEEIMIDPEIDFDAAADELAIIELWDALPDRCKTQKLWEQVKDKHPTAPLSKLKPIDNKDSISNG